MPKRSGAHTSNNDPSNYDLLVTDHDMPGLSGLELVKKLRAACMQPPVIFATGYLSKETITQNSWLQPAALLLKPYTIAELLVTVKQVLHAAAADRGQNTPQPNWQSQPSVRDLQL